MRARRPSALARAHGRPVGADPRPRRAHPGRVETHVVHRRDQLRFLLARNHGAKMDRMTAEPIDLRHQETEEVVGVYLLETEDGPALFDCGPRVCVPELERGLSERGLKLED